MSASEKKFCPECQKLGLRSRISVGIQTSTLMAVQTYYDEDRLDDPNTTTTQYACSNGHRWIETH